MDSRRSLTEEELEYFANHLSEISEDGLENDEDTLEEDPDYLPDLSQDNISLSFDNDLSELYPQDISNELSYRIEELPIELEDGMMLEADNVLAESQELSLEAEDVLAEQRENNFEEERNRQDTLESNIKVASTNRYSSRLNKSVDKENSKPKQKKKTPLYNLKELKRQKNNLIISKEELEFKANTDSSTEIVELSTPHDFFKYFFTDDNINSIVEESSLFSIQKNASKPANVTGDDIRKYIGICFYMSIVHLPSIRSYWSGKIGYDRVINTMPLRTFEKIRQFLHFNDNSQLNKNDKKHDRLHKIRPLIEELRKGFHKVPFEKYLSVDEQLCATKVRHYLLQYIPLKPHKWGFKFFVISGVSGFTYDFEIYSGQENYYSKRLETEVDLGASGNVVVRLLRNVPKHVNYRVYFDNYYTSLPLITYLQKNGIYCIGTARRNRIANCPFPEETLLKKEKRGKSSEYTTEIEGTKISAVLWKDTKSVILLSTFCGELPKEEVKRFDKSERKKISIQGPKAVKEYNHHMGGVDLTDSLIGRYKIRIRSKKWYMRLFYHMLDVSMVNAWLLYRRVSEEKNQKDILTLCNFRTEVAECLCRVSQRTSVKRGRPSSIEKEIAAKCKKKSAAVVPPEPVRKDSTGHWPIIHAKRETCKFPKCKGITSLSVRNVKCTCV